MVSTDSEFERKSVPNGRIRPEYKYAYNFKYWKDKRLMKAIPLLKAMRNITSISLEDYLDNIQQTADGLRDNYKTITGQKLERNLYESEKKRIS